MRFYRVAVSILVLIAIAMSAPTVARARYRDQVGDVGAFDTDLELPIAVEVYECSGVDVIRGFTILDETRDLAACHASALPVLATAPKTSPPLV